MVGWVGNESWRILTSYWHPQAQRRSLPPKFSDRPKNPKNKKKQNRLKTKKLKFPESPSVQWLPKISKNQFFTKTRNFQIRQKYQPILIIWLGGWATSPEESLHHTDTHKHSAVASRQNFQTAQKNPKIKILKLTKNQKTWNFQNPRVSSDSQNNKNSIFWQNPKFSNSSKIDRRSPSDIRRAKEVGGSGGSP